MYIKGDIKKVGWLKMQWVKLFGALVVSRDNNFVLVTYHYKGVIYVAWAEDLT